MELWISSVLTALGSGVLGGLAAHVFGTHFLRKRGGYEDHEERLGTLESLVRTVHRAQKAERMRSLREAPPEAAERAPPADGAVTRASLKAALRQRVRGMQ
jgi:hypothetical protein